MTGSAVAGGSPYTAGGWTNQPVTVSFACADTLSGPDLLSITGNTTIETQQTTTADGSCKDLAGNQGTGSFGPINIDTTGPAIVVVSPQNGQFFVLNQQITPDFTCGEGAGGIDAAACTITPSADPYTATPLGPGTFSVNATDDAGNSASASVQYSVIYKFTGFLAPLQTAGTNSDSGSFNAGNIIPVEWQLQDAGDVYFSDLATLRTIQAFPNATCSGGPAGTATALYDSSNGTGQLAFSYDMPNNRFVFNWDTTGLSAGCYNLVVTPDDATANNTLVHLQ